MYVNYSGWSEKHGSFSCDIFIDENRQDSELTFGDGRIAKQKGPFEAVTADWNHDGDVYTQFGAWFTVPGENHSDFWSVVDLVRAAADAQAMTRRPYGNEIVSVKGVEIPPPDRRSSLHDTIQRSELRAMHQEIERNRKMDMLGIRPPNEPWAR